MRASRVGRRTRGVGAMLCGGLALATAACGGEVEQGSALGRTHGDLTEGAAAGSQLSCADLLAQLKAELLARVDATAEQARNGGGALYPGAPLVRSVALARSISLTSSPASNAPASAVAGFSPTTSLMEGVEDGDFVKTDGDRIYLLHEAKLFIADTSGDALALVGALDIEGATNALLVRDGNVLVVSSVYSELPDESLGLPGYYQTYSKLTLVDGAADTPVVLRESYLRGYSYSLALTGDVARVVVQDWAGASLDYPSISYVDFLGRPRSQREIDAQVDLWALLEADSIERATLEDFLPERYERVAGQLTSQPPRCEDFLLLPGGENQAGSSHLLSIDLADPTSAWGDLAVLGGADSLQVGASSALLVHTDYGDGGALSTIHTTLHQFQLDGVAVIHSASADIAGYFATTPDITEAGLIRAVILRLDATDTGAGSQQVVTLAEEQGTLRTIGSLTLPADESVSTAGFVGDRGYVVSSAATSRLRVLDLSDPSAPVQRGQLETKNYISLLSPLGGGALLSVSQRQDLLGFASRTAVQLFDVSDADAPRLAGEHEYSSNVYSEASYDAHALSIHPDQNVFGINIQDYTRGQSSFDVFRWSAQSGPALLGSVASETQEMSIEQCLPLLGYALDPALLEELEQDPEASASLLQQCRSFAGTSIRRGLFKEDEVFTLSTVALSRRDLAALDGPAESQIELPASTSPTLLTPLPTESAPTSE